MTPSPTLQELIDEVKADASGQEALIQLSQASKTVNDLEQVGDALLGHFVDQCRRGGHSWSEISRALGVSKQAAHKRFTSEQPTFERFTERAKSVLMKSETEAHRLGHGFVGTEHILLALFDVPDGLAMRVLDAVGVSKPMVEERVLALIKRTSASEGGRLPFTPRAKSVLSESAAVALDLGHNYIGTEHLLLGMFADENSVAAKVLQQLGTSQRVLQDRTVEMLAGYGED
jgi:Clp amino terminal domain, pathogenicity island component